MSSIPTPIVYPTTVTCLKRSSSQATTTADTTAWATVSGNNGIVYEYKSSNSNVSLNTSNCTPYQKQPSTLMNSCWSGVHQKPFNSAGIGGGDKKIQTMIFEPGDYYFTAIQLTYDATKELVIDPNAYASGRTPGPVRFWVYDPYSASRRETRLTTFKCRLR